MKTSLEGYFWDDVTEVGIKVKYLMFPVNKIDATYINEDNDIVCNWFSWEKRFWFSSMFI